MDRSERTQRLYSDIREEYHRLRAVREHGVRKYSDDYILAVVAKKFYRSPRTISNIVFHRV